jgi:hypothetical protein
MEEYALGFILYMKLKYMITIAQMTREEKKNTIKTSYIKVEVV